MPSVQAVAEKEEDSVPISQMGKMYSGEPGGRSGARAVWEALGVPGSHWNRHLLPTPVSYVVGLRRQP